MLPASEPEATVIVCEDDAPTLDLLCDHLHADRFQALAAPSAADALRLCHYNDPDLLLLDLRLPDASGLDVLREIRASAGPTGRFDPVLPVIVLSGRSTEVDRVRGFAEGADDYVVKPARYSLSRKAGAAGVHLEDWSSTEAVQALARVNVTCVTPLGEEVASTS
jgi:CheY-like chemotaxis protein